MKLAMVGDACKRNIVHPDVGGEGETHVCARKYEHSSKERLTDHENLGEGGENKSRAGGRAVMGELARSAWGDIKI
jgi:hypothetical protein